jgi:hypothetical protein
MCRTKSIFNFLLFKRKFLSTMSIEEKDILTQIIQEMRIWKYFINYRIFSKIIDQKETKFLKIGTGLPPPPSPWSRHPWISYQSKNNCIQFVSTLRENYIDRNLKKFRHNFFVSCLLMYDCRSFTLHQFRHEIMLIVSNIYKWIRILSYLNSIHYEGRRKWLAASERVSSCYF